MANDARKGLDRRSLLVGAAAGGVAAGAAAVGADRINSLSRPYLTPAALPAGEPPRIAESFQDSRPASTDAVKAPSGAPNILVIVLDDVGFADLGCYGSEIRTPAIDALAARGLRYNNFRTCAMCSPTRAALLTGLNHHSAGMGWLADIDAGYPGYRGALTHDAATIAEVLQAGGWSTFLVGKWHVNYTGTNGANGPYDNWPTSRGFDRAYWFQGHSTDYFRPSELFDGQAPVEPPERADYFVNDDLTDRAIAYLRTQKALDPKRPFYLQLAYPGTHSPLQAPPADRDAYKGAYDTGWDVLRAARLARQKAMGLMPADTPLPPLSFGAEPWATLSPLQRRLYARYMEVYAGLMSNVDRNVGRMLEAIEALGETDNTLVVLLSDNGGSAEGTPTGTPNVFAPAFGRPVPIEKAAELYDIMGEDGTFPHYPQGWTNCSTTPFRQYKQYTNLGGTADPLIISWPRGIAARGEIRSQFAHVIDLFPTMLECAGVSRPESYRGRALKPVEGRSIKATFASTTAPTRTEQYFELAGSRAYMDGNWRLVSRHERGKPFEDDAWELYDLARDPNEMVDLAAREPERVKAMQAKWRAAAVAHNVFPLDDRNLIIRLVQDRRAKGIRADWDLRPPIERLSRDVAPIVCGLSHSIEVRFDHRGDGVLVAQGSKHAGYVLHVRDGRLVYEQSLVPWVERIEPAAPLPRGSVTVRYVQRMTARPFDGEGTLYIGDRAIATHRFERVLFAPGYDGFSIGADLGNQVSTYYSGPNPAPGRIEQVRITVETDDLSLSEQQRFLDAMGLRV